MRMFLMIFGHLRHPMHVPLWNIEGSSNPGPKRSFRRSQSKSAPKKANDAAPKSGIEGMRPIRKQWLTGETGATTHTTVLQGSVSKSERVLLAGILSLYCCKSTRTCIVWQETGRSVVRNTVYGAPHTPLEWFDTNLLIRSRL